MDPGSGTKARRAPTAAPKLGKTPSFADGQIAAIAHANGLTLVTLNLSDFQEFRGLQIEDWQA